MMLLIVWKFQNKYYTMALHYFNTYFYNEVILDGVKNQLVDVPTYVYASANTMLNDNPPANSINYAYDAGINTLLFGKRILEDSVYSMVARREWQYGTVYQRYSCRCPDLSERVYYIINSQRSIYKCIDNNYNAQSIVEPTFLDSHPTTLADGYTWQFMYRLTENQLSTLSTPDYIPVIPDANVAAAAIPGTIDLVSVGNRGIGYTATHTGNISAVVSNNVIGIDNSASTLNGTYVDSSIYITSGSGAGQLSRITSYNSNSIGRFVTLETPLTGITLSSIYNIAPSVIINGNGSGATARTIMQDASIDKIEIVERGQGYTYADVAITANTLHGSGATAFATLSPIKGHGHSPAIELASKNLLIHMDFQGNELAQIPVDVSFSRYGLINNLKDTSNNEVVFSGNSFNNTSETEISMVAGNFNSGDIVEATNDSTKKAKILFANNDTYIISYINKTLFNPLDQIICYETNARGQINTITPPDVYTYEANPLSVRVIDSVTRSATGQESINILLEF